MVDVILLLLLFLVFLKEVKYLGIILYIWIYNFSWGRWVKGLELLNLKIIYFNIVNKILNDVVIYYLFVLLGYYIDLWKYYFNGFWVI